MHLKRALFGILLIFALVMLLLIQVPTYASPDEVIRDPTAEYQVTPKWNFPQEAFSSNDLYASTMISGSQHVWYDYGFQDVLGENDTIVMVEVGLEHYETFFNEELNVWVTWDAGGTWSDEACIYSADETLDWLDATGVTDWNLEKLSDSNLRVKVQFLAGVGGCYPTMTYFVVYDERMMSYVLRDASQIREKEMLLVWSAELGIHRDRVLRVDSHYGNWSLLDFYSGTLTFQSKTEKLVWQKHLIVTENHPLWNPLLNKRVEAKAVTVEDSLTHVNHGNLTMLPIDRIERFDYTGNVYSIVFQDPQVCLFAKSFSERELASLERDVTEWERIGILENIALAIKVPFTAYLDWVPMRVTFTPYAPEISDEELLIGCLVIMGALGSCLIFALKFRRD